MSLLQAASSSIQVCLGKPFDSSIALIVHIALVCSQSALPSHNLSSDALFRTACSSLQNAACVNVLCVAAEDAL